ncbi:MAG: hypothetical protein NVS1B13_07030 [Flavisolibacter sp.]
MFDKIEHNIYIKKNDQLDIILLDKNQIKYFEIENHLFVSGKILSGGDEKMYYEKLTGIDDKLQLYKLITTKYVKSDKTDLERIKRGDFNDEFKDEVSYYLKRNKEAIQIIRIKEKSIIKILPAQAQRIKSFVDNHYNEQLDESFMIRLINFLNE